MVADFFTKPLQGHLFYKLRDFILNCGCDAGYEPERSIASVDAASSPGEPLDTNHKRSVKFRADTNLSLQECVEPLGSDPLTPLTPLTSGT